MLIKLTNASAQFDGKTIVINSDHIITMFEDKMLVGTAVEQPITNVYVPPHGTWQVKESLETICRILAEDPKQHLLNEHKPAGISMSNGAYTVVKETKTRKKTKTPAETSSR